MNDKTDRLLEAIDDPDRFSDDELAQLLTDAETRELYDLMSKTSDALVLAPEPDIDREWTRFVNRRNAAAANGSRHFRILRNYISRNAAAAVIFVIASVAVAATTIGVARSHKSADDISITDHQPEISAPVAQKAAGSDSIASAVDKTSTISVFHDQAFADVISTIANHYGASVTYRDDKPKSLRLYFKWDQSESLAEVVEQLNYFKQLNITLDGDNLTIH